MDAATGSLRATVEQGLWPAVEALLGAHEMAGLAIGVVRGDQAVSRGFGVRDVRRGAAVTPETLFHLASVSKPFVATAIVSLAAGRGTSEPVVDLDAPIVEWVPELTLADGRQAEITARHLLSHSSGLPDVADYGWHDPQLGDDALTEFARSLSAWRLQSDPGSTFSYSNAGYEIVGLALSRATGTTFENAMRERVLRPLGMEKSTFLRSEVPEELAASPHVGMPLSVPEGAYPYTRRHAPSSTLRSNIVEMCRWMVSHFEPDRKAPSLSASTWDRLDAVLLERMWRPVVTVGRPPWEEVAALGWAVGTYRGHRTVSHSGMDPGFGSKLVLVPDRRTGVVVLANSNTVPTSAVAAAALDLVVDDATRPATARASPRAPADGVSALRALRPSVVGPVARTLSTSGPEAARRTYHRLAAAEPVEVDLDDEGFVDAVWGAIELHRTDLAWPVLRVWTVLRPESSAAWTMSGWAHQVDGRLVEAGHQLRQALALDPQNDEAALLLSSMAPD